MNFVKSYFLFFIAFVKFVLLLILLPFAESLPVNLRSTERLPRLFFTIKSDKL